MKAVAYSIKPFEKEYLAIANRKKHVITLITNPLNFDTLNYAEGKDAVIVFSTDNVSAGIIEKLAGLNIKYIISRSLTTDHIDKAAAAKYGIKIAHVVPGTTRQPHLNKDALPEIADQTIHNLDLYKIAEGRQKIN